MIPLGNDFDIILTFIPSSDEQYHPIKHDLKAHPEFPVGGAHLVGGRQLPTRKRFEKCVCQSERIGTLRGGARRVRPHWIRQWHHSNQEVFYNSGFQVKIS